METVIYSFICHVIAGGAQEFLWSSKMALRSVEISDQQFHKKAYANPLE